MSNIIRAFVKTQPIFLRGYSFIPELFAILSIVKSILYSTMHSYNSTVTLKNITQVIGRFMIKAITYNFLSSVDNFDFKGRRRNVLTVTVGECTVKWLHVNTLADECLPRADVRSAESQWRVCDLCCYLLSLSTLVLLHSLSHTVYCISVCLAGVKQPDAITRSAPLKNKLYNGEFITVFTNYNTVILWKDNILWDI